jgi:hypothetical protein
MPARIAMGAASWWEPLVALTITAGAIAGLVVLGGRVYAGAILHSGATLTVRDAWRRAAPGPERAPRTRASEHRPHRAEAVAIAGGIVSGALTIAFTRDVVIGVAVGAATVALVDRGARIWRGPGGPTTTASGPRTRPPH